jgi:hypothetical protein
MHMNKTEQRELAQARAIAATMPDYAARVIAIMRRSTRNRVTLAMTDAAIAEHQLEAYFEPGTNYMLAVRS